MTNQEQFELLADADVRNNTALGQKLALEPMPEATEASPVDLNHKVDVLDLFYPPIDYNDFNV